MSVRSHLRGRRSRTDLATLGLPEVSCVGTYDMIRAERDVAAERHEDELELVLVKRGEFAYFVAGIEHHVAAGEMLVIRPGESHGGSGLVLTRCTHYWMKFRIGFATRRPASFLGLGAAEGQELVASLQALPSRQFRVGPGVAAGFEEIAVMVEAQPTSPLHRLAIASRIAFWLTSVVCSAHQPHQDARTDEVREAARWMQDHPDEPFDIEAFAESAGTAVGRFRQKFRTQIGVPIHDFHLEAKVIHARKMLAAEPDRTITDIAFTLGFSSSQYFSTVFNRYTTMTPTEFRRRSQANPA